jgi:hypothetical protein
MDDGGGRRTIQMRWRDGLFAHWSVAPETVADSLPDRLGVASHDGRAWLGIVGFGMEGIRPLGLPRRFGRSFPELNLRTYIERNGTRGVYFYNHDADDRLSVAIARRLCRLPYYRAEMRLSTAGRTTLRSRRTHPGVPGRAFPRGVSAD